jgi:hypothetical protein
LFRTFVFGVILGLLGAGAFLYFIPVVDQHRVPSKITVQTNGGNSEVFSIRLPGDRIMTGSPGSASSIPDGLAWPEIAALDGFKAELFKIRDSDNTVVGVGSRMARSAASGDSFVQWVVHLPARGSLFVAMDPNRAPGQARGGALSAGTREFATLSGTIREAFIRDDEGAEGDSEGRIDLHVALVGPQEEAL